MSKQSERVGIQTN